MLVEKGVNVNAVDESNRRTPLHCIVYADYPHRVGHKDWTEDDYFSMLIFFILVEIKGPQQNAILWIR